MFLLQFGVILPHEPCKHVESSAIFKRKWFKPFHLSVDKNRNWKTKVTSAFYFLALWCHIFHECEIVTLQEGIPGFHEGFESLPRNGVCHTLMLLHGWPVSHTLFVLTVWLCFLLGMCLWLYVAHPQFLFALHFTMGCSPRSPGSWGWVGRSSDPEARFSVHLELWPLFMWSRTHPVNKKHGMRSSSY